MDQLPLAHDVFPHIRIVMGMVIGLGVTRLLSGVARIVHHPTQYPLYTVHLLWVVSVLLMLVHFWWWQFGLYGIGAWTFGIYLFVLLYAVALFLLCAFLFPESMQDYKSYEDFFYARRGWFFGLLAATYLRTPLFVALCLVAMRTENRRFHTGLVAFTLIYQVSWIVRLFDTIG